MARAATHWADVGERGAAWGPALLAFVYRVLGRGVCLVAMTPAVLYFFLTGARQRRASLDYLRRAWAASGRPGKPGLWLSFEHFLAFGVSLVDRLGAWLGQIDRAEVEAIDGAEFEAMRDDRRGALIVSAHFGATEVVRAIASRHQPRRITIVMHSAHAERYNAAIERFAPQSRISLIQAADFSIAAAAQLSAAIERGEWVVMMGDRLPVRRDGRTIVAEFLGAPAAFPQGPFVLAAALRCPVYALFCYRAGKRYRVRVSQLSDGLAAPRGQRAAALASLVQRYAHTLETLVREAPYQWFNFYDYWAADAAGAQKRDGES